MMIFPFVKAAVEPDKLKTYLEACKTAAQQLKEAGVPKEEIAKKMTEAVNVVLDFLA